MLLLRPLRHGGHFAAVPLQARVNFCGSTRGPANFCPKPGHHKHFCIKQQDRSSSSRFCDEDLFFIFLVFIPKFKGKIRTKGEYQDLEQNIHHIAAVPHSECVWFRLGKRPPKVFVAPESHYSGAGSVTILFYLQCANYTESRQIILFCPTKCQHFGET